MREKLLVLGCSHAEVPIVRAAKELGLKVGTIGNDKSGAAFSVSDYGHIYDYSNFDQAIGVFDKYSYDAVVAGCNDFAAFTRSRIGEVRDIGLVDSLTQTSEIHFKDRFRNICFTLGISSPRAVSVFSQDFSREELYDLRFPVLVKPTDLTGGKGLTLCMTMREIEAAVVAAVSQSRRSFIVIEEFVAGTLHSASFWLENGLPILMTHADEFMYRNPYLVAAALAPSSVPEKILSSVADDMTRLVESLKLSQGILHVQFLVSESNYYVLEVCRRPPGDLYLLLPTAFEGLSISDLLVRQAMGLETFMPMSTSQIRPTLRICLMPDRNGVVVNLQLSDHLMQLGSDLTVLRDFPSSVDDYLNAKFGIVLVSADNRSLLESFAKEPSLVFSASFRA